MAPQQSPSLQQRPLLPSLNSLSRLVHSPPPPLPSYSHQTGRSPTILPSCAQMASTCPPADFHSSSYPSPSPSVGATSLPPVSSIAPLLHACSAASHAMSTQQQQEEHKPNIKQEDATPSSAPSLEGPYSPARIYGSRTGGSLGSSASFVGAEGGWGHQQHLQHQHQQIGRSAAGSSTSGSFSAEVPTPMGAEDGTSKGKGKCEDVATPKIKSASPDSVGSGEGGAASGKTLKQTKRAAQNREAQRAFRSRKEQYIKELEQTSTLYTALQQTHTSLTHRLTSLEQSLTSLESDRARFDSERMGFEAERNMWERERAAFAAERSSFAQERAGWAGEKLAWEGERRRLIEAEVPRGRNGASEEAEGEGEKIRQREEARRALRMELELDGRAPGVKGSGGPAGTLKTEDSTEREGKRPRIE